MNENLSSQIDSEELKQNDILDSDLSLIKTHTEFLDFALKLKTRQEKLQKFIPNSFRGRSFYIPKKNSLVIVQSKFEEASKEAKMQPAKR